MKARLFAFSLSFTSALFSQEMIAEASPSASNSQGYTINYNTVPAVEYIRFASKICNVNFIFDETELNFTVSVVSDAPITSENVMATLVQVLRIHGMTMLEQDNSLVIHKSPSVKQIATIVTKDGQEANSPIVTRIFRPKIMKVDALSAIISPMISSDSILDTSPETQQLILTDVTANVNKVASLIEILDTPVSLLEVKTYNVQHNSPETLILLAGQIMGPIAQGNPFILVPQVTSNSIFIVSSPDLVQRATAILTSLDTQPKKAILTERKLMSEDIFIYKAVNRSAESVIHNLMSISDSLQKSGLVDSDLIQTIDTAKAVPQTNSILFTGSKESIAKVKEFLVSIDAETNTGYEKSSFFIYRPQVKSAQEIGSALKDLAKNLKGTKGADESLVQMIEGAKVNAATNTIVFSGEERNFTQVRELLTTLDSGKVAKGPGKNGFFIYKIQHADAAELEGTLKNFAKTLDKSNVSDEGLTQSIQSLQYIKETNSLLFTGNESDLARLKELVPSFDTGMVTIPSSNQFYIYKPRYRKGDQIASSIKEIAGNLDSDEYKDPAFVRTLQSMKYVKSTNSLLFTGDTASIQRLETLIAGVDQPQAGPESEQTFFLYAPLYASREKTESYLRQLGDNLNKKREEDLVSLIRSAKWIEPSHSFMFHGTEGSIARLKVLLADFDKPNQSAPVVQKGFFIYSVQYAPQEKVGQYLDQVADNLSKKGTNPDLADAIRSKKWIEESHSYMFNGTDSALAQIKELLKTYDTPEEQQKKNKSGYYIYKVQHTSGEAIEEDLDALAKNFKSTDLKDAKILDVINKIRYVKETNSLLLTGDPTAIEEVKAMIADYDYPRAQTAVNSNFFMYKPQHLSAVEIRKNLSDIASNLKSADLADPTLLKTIETAKYVESTNSLVFTGPPDTLQKVQLLIKDIDIPPTSHAPIQHIGKTTFLLYKLKNAGGPQIISSIQAMTTDLKKSNQSDKEFLSALQSVKYVKETNSLLFTGTEEALARVQTLVEQFDVVGLSPGGGKPAPVSGQPNFLLYKPTSVTGPELEKIMHDFAENLRLSGLADPDLFNAITSMRFVEKSQSLIFTGTPKALDQVKELLTSFDIPANGTQQTPIATEPSIQAIDNTSFLVYKLQFHKGDEIQSALRQIAKDLTMSNAPVNQNLLNSINSIQWLEVTNSLLSSGDQETLTRLRELIKNLDIPLKQVFIEMLVIETTLVNTLNFGLEWGANYKYKDSFAGSMFNTTPQTSSNGTTLTTNDSFINYLSQLTPPTAPTPVSNSAGTTGIVPGTGFDLGVIGEVIKHNGSTFLTIGSLLTALQSDTETSIVMTPKIIAQDGRTSSIFVGINQPFAGSFVSNTAQGATVQTSNIEYRDIGLQLTITPVLGNSDIVTLDISLDRSSIATNVAGTTISTSGGSATGITTSKTTMQTTVHVPNENFLILSGFVNNSSAKVTSGIPCLGGLPIIGAAFSKSNDTVSNDNIVIFLRPRIVNSLEDMRRISADQEDFFRDQAGTPYLEHNYNEAMELIKTIDDE
jgi:type II secretory pathway component GspD/PulD (secretin)